MNIQDIIVEVGSKELFNEAEDVLRRSFGSSFRYAKAVVDYGAGLVAIARINNDVAGAVVFYNVLFPKVKLCVIYYIAVLEEFRRMGLGSVLMSTAEEVCADTDLYIATTWYGNDAADALYKTLGYTAYSWNELRRLLGRRTVDRLLKATCGYDDDLAYVKSSYDANVIDLLRLVSEGNAEGVNKLWKETCLYTWLRIKGTT